MFLTKKLKDEADDWRSLMEIFKQKMLHMNRASAFLAVREKLVIQLLLKIGDDAGKSEQNLLTNKYFEEKNMRV